MMKKTPFVISMTAALAMLVVSTAQAVVYDLTTFDYATAQGRAARYTTMLGNRNGDTIWDNGSGGNDFQGLYDYASDKGNGSIWWRLNDGDDTRRCDTFAGETEEDFVGYMFKRSATVQSIDFVNNPLRDGGTFAATPRVEVLVGGTEKSGGIWQAVSATWDTPYVIDYGLDGTGGEIRPYQITVDTSVGDVWGVRLIGAPLDHWYNSYNVYCASGDTTGFISVTELTVTGDLDIADRVDLTDNLASGQTPIFAFTATDPQYLTDDGYDDYGDNKSHYAHTHGGDLSTLPDGREYMGVMFDSPQADVTAVGTAQKFYYDNSEGGIGAYGGCLTPESIKVEYTTDAGTTWLEVTGLDIGRYAEDFDDLLAVPWGQHHTELFTFNTIGVAIDGIRVSGVPYANPDASDPDGFLSSVELEVFAGNIQSDKIPGDANNDGKVDGSDVTILANNWQLGVPDGGVAIWEDGDFNGDGKVDGSDVTILANNWQRGVLTASATVPEPSIILLLLSTGLMLLPRWSRRHKNVKVNRA